MLSLKLPNLFRRAADRRSLKERAASLRATVAQRTHAEPATIAELTGPDAALLALAPGWEAAVSLYDQRVAEENAAAEAPCAVEWPGPAPAGSGPRYEAWRQEVERWRMRSGVHAAEMATGEVAQALHGMELRIASMPATTLAGLRLKARVAKRSDDAGVEWPKGLGEGLTRDILALTDMASGSGADHAHTAIAKHQASYAAWEPHMTAIGELKVRSEAYRAAQAAGDPARRSEDKAFDDLISTQAQTWPGLVALAAYVPEAIRLTGLEGSIGAPEQALASICSSILNLSRSVVLAAPAQAEIPAPPTPSNGAALSPTRQWAVEQAAKVDLSGLDILRLHNLYGLFAGTADTWSAASCVPWAQEEPCGPWRALNAGGELVEREEGRAAEIRDRIVTEIRARVPTGNLEHDWRLEILTRHELLCEGSLRAASPELRAEINEAWGG